MKWELKTLDQLGTVSRGRSKHRPRNDPSLFGGKYPFIQTADVKSANFYITEYDTTYNEKGLAQSKLWNPGTLCITIAANIADTGILAMDACFPDSVMGFIPYEGVSDVRFVKYCFDILQANCKKISQGAAQDNLSWEKLSTIQFPAPPIENQRKIADILSTYDNLIENNQKQIKLLEEAARRLYKEWFVDLRFPGHETTPIVDGVPEGWSVESMDDIAEYINGYAFKPSDWGTSGKPIIKIKEMGLGVTSDTPRNSGENIPEKYNITAGDILFSWSATLSAMIWDEEDGLLNQHLFKVIPCDGVSREFVLQSILKTLDEFSNLTTGSTMKHIQRGKLKEVHVNVPNERTMRKYKSISEPIREQLLNLKREIILLQEARDRLLPKLMSGEIEVQIMDMLEPPSQIVNVYLPPDFKHKSVNEPFIQKMMELALGRRNWVPGNADKFQPDYFCDGIPFEFTMASNRKDKENYIQKFYSGKYTTDDVAQDAFQYIQESIQQKLKKTYSVPNVHLCVLCLIDLTDWVLDEYGSVTHCILDGDRQDFFEWIKSQCIDSKKFNNVFVIFPDMFATWWIWDVLTGHKANIRLSEADILSGQYPFWMNQQSYEELMKLSGNKKW